MNFNKVYELVKLLDEIGKRYDKKPAQVALNWLITSYPNILPIPGAKNPDQVKDNAGAANWRLSFSDWLKIDQRSRDIRITRVL
jgi:aryl-alcohol dehydrogenase-like predicted oxidoreductase